ncbi:MAG: LPS export ABC transporter permease LptF [Pseudomonadota bacterium]|nr:LPS export ABC transporter permease LptF [Pseudomonadota bacterium]
MRTGKLVTRLDRYVFRQLLFALIAVTGGLTALIWLTQSLRFVELVVDHGLSLGVFLELTGLLVPSFVAVILPITTFVVVQFVYQRLAGDRELTVMRAAGLSPFALARPALALALLVAVCCYALNLWIVPASLGDFRDFQWEIRNRVAAFLLQEGVFTEVSRALTVYVRARDPDGALHGILIDDARQAPTHATILAERGRLVETPNGPEVVLIDGSRQEIDPRTGRLNLLTFKENVIDLNDASRQGARLPDMSEVTLPALLDPHPANAREIPRWIAEAHKRLATPLTAIAYALVALLSVLSGTFRRHGSIVRPLAAVGAVVGLLALQLVFDDMAARDNALLPLIWAQPVLPALACGWLLFGPQVLYAGYRRIARPQLTAAPRPGRLVR